MMFKAASVLTAAGMVLVAANWYTKPEAGLAWTAPLAMFAVMLAALRLSRLALRRSTGDATARRSADWITTGVVFGALMMGIPLALTLARAYGVVNDPDLGRRSTGVLVGAFLVMLGNVMPKTLPPLSSMQCDGARVQAFQRLAGWTWVLSGLGSAMAWIALSIDSAEIATTVLVVAAMVVTIVQMLRLRLRRPRNPAPGLS
jgi:ethanolamine transporter EutH